MFYDPALAVAQPFQLPMPFASEHFDKAVSRHAIDPGTISQESCSDGYPKEKGIDEVWTLR